MEKENKNQGTFLNKFNFLIHTFCGKQMTRPEIGGIFVSPKETCATDSFKIIKVSTPKNLDVNDYPVIPNRPKPISNFKSFILSREKAKSIVSIFSSQKDSESLPLLNNAVIVRNDKERVEIGKTDLESYDSVMSRKLEGEFPNYNKMFVENGKFIEIDVNQKFLKEVVDFYVNFVDSPTGGVKIKIPIKGGEAIRFYAKRKDGQETNALLMPIKSTE